LHRGIRIIGVPNAQFARAIVTHAPSAAVTFGEQTVGLPRPDMGHGLGVDCHSLQRHPHEKIQNSGIHNILRVLNQNTQSGSRALREADVFDKLGRRKYLNDAERRAFFLSSGREGDTLRRALCLTLYYTGCRISEALNLTAQNIDLSQKSIVFETLKRRRRGVFRSVPIPENFAKQLGELLAGDSEATRIWPWSRPTAYRLVKARMMQAGISGNMASPKGLRHAFAIACISKNIPLPTIQKWMGHARLETTAIYLDVCGDEERKFAQKLWESP
jgi:integrase